MSEVIHVSDPFTCYYDPDHGKHVGGVVVHTFYDGNTRVFCPRFKNSNCVGRGYSGKPVIKGECFRFRAVGSAESK